MKIILRIVPLLLVLTSCVYNQLEKSGKFTIYEKKDDILTNILTIEGDNRSYTFKSKLGIDIESLKDYGEFLKDKNKVYRKYDVSEGTVIFELKDVDQQTFQVLDNSIYAKDKLHVFDSRNGLIDGADANSFEIVKIDERLLGKDRNHYFFWNEIVEDTLFGQSKLESNNFQLTYIYAGLGSGYNSMQPVFKVNGTDCIYTLEESSSFTGEYTQKPDTLFIGSFRKTSIDSIIELTTGIKDTLVYSTNPEIMSGGIHSIKIETNKINVTFRLQNSSDPIAEKIVAILNSNIPEGVRKLWLFNMPENK